MRVFWLFRRVRSIFRSSTEVSVSFGLRKVFNQVMAGLSSRLRGNGIGVGRRRSMSALNGTKNESSLERPVEKSRVFLRNCQDNMAVLPFQGFHGLDEALEA